MNTTNTTDSTDNALIVGAGFTIEGTVQGQGTLLVHGTIKGSVEADVVKLNESALVVGHIECRQLDVSGRLDGSFETADVVVRQGGAILIQDKAISTGTALVAGAVSGPLKAAQLKVERSGQVSGHLQADRLDVHGHVQGELAAGEMVVRSSGTVAGNVHYGNLSMERGSDVSGQLQRADHQAAPAAAARADETVVIHLPVNIVQQLRKQPDDLRLSLANGEPLPSWISVDREHAWLVLGKAAYNQLVARGQSITLRLQAGAEDLVFQLPPDAQ